MPVSTSTRATQVDDEKGSRDPVSDVVPIARTVPNTVLDHEELIARSQRGDRAAFRQLFLRHRDEVVRLAFRIMGPSARVEEIVQDVFGHIHRHLTLYRSSSTFRTGLQKITVDVIVRKRRLASSGSLQHEASDSRDPSAPSPEEIARRERMRAFWHLVDSLDEKNRTIFLLHELEGWSLGQIGEVVGLSELAVRARLLHARRDLGAKVVDEPSLTGLVDTKMPPWS